MEITKKDSEDSYLKNIDFESYKYDINEEIQNIKYSNKARDLNFEWIIKQIDQDLTNLVIESNEGRDHLNQEVHELRAEVNELSSEVKDLRIEMNSKFNMVIKTFSGEIRNLNSDLNQFKESMKIFLGFFIVLHFFMIFYSYSIQEKMF
jgi:predicted nuclease with TOPRIM domain